MMTRRLNSGDEAGIAMNSLPNADGIHNAPRRDQAKSNTRNVFLAASPRGPR